MNKNLVIVVIAVSVVVALGVGAYLMLNNNDGSKASLDIDEASSKLASSTPFNEMATMDITSDILESVYGINPENVEKVAGKAPMMNVHSSMYMIIQAKEGTVDTVKAELDTYLGQYEEQWSRYLPEQYEYVQNRKERVIGNSIYVIISENSAALEKEIIK